MRTVNLQLAFAWTCDNCGRDNFVRSQIIYVEYIIRTLGLKAKKAVQLRNAADEHGMVCRAPDFVTCGHCGVKFNAEEGT